MRQMVFATVKRKALKKVSQYDTRKQLSIMRDFKNKLRIQTQKLARFTIRLFKYNQGRRQYTL